MPDSSQAHPTKTRSQAGWHVLGILLVAGWAVVMGLMFSTGQDAQAVPLDAGDLPGALQEEQSWMGAYYQGRKLGYVHARITRVTGGFRLHQQARLVLRLGNQRQRIATSLDAFLEGGFLLKTFAFELESDFLNARMQGSTEGDQLVVEMLLGDEVQRKRFTLTEPPMFDLTIPKVLARRDLAAGQRYRIMLFDPQTLVNRPAVIEVMGRDAIKVEGDLVPAVHLRRRLHGQNLDTWIDERGTLLAEKYEMGLELRREDEATARAPVSDQALAPLDGDAGGLLRGLFGRGSPPAPDEEPKP